MREILFRGKDVNNKWHFGNFIKDKYYFSEEICYSIYSVGCGEHQVIPETAGQYTGLTDKNGTKIFEGDIVKVSYTDGFEIGAICWSNLNFRFCFNTPEGFSYGFNVSDELEVIGNIHDNPELLEGENDNA